MSLYLKYRPKTLDQVKGNENTIKALEGMLSDPKGCQSHVFLLYGPTGCGKTTIGRIIAERLGCGENDFKEVDSADFRGIDTVRAIREQSYLAPLEGSCRIWMMDEIHKMTNDAQNALLKILEDTPNHVYFILCTTDPQKLLPTIRGRCKELQVFPLTQEQIVRLLSKVATQEGKQIDLEVLEQIAQDSLGHPRNALQILEKVLNVDRKSALEVAKQAADQQYQAIELCRALLKRQSWDSIAKILKSLKDQEPESIRRMVLGYCQSVLLSKDDETAGLILEMFMKPFYDTNFPGLVWACYAVIKN